LIFSYDAESKIVEVSGAATDSFVYDGDGNRVKSIVGSTTTVFIGNYYEWESNATRKHYYAGANRIAMRDGETLYFLFGDHLGSTSLSYRVSDGYVARHLYKPWGEKRYPPGASELPTKYRFTGQYVQNELWLYYYNARWYDNRVGRFIQADTDVPESQGENQNPTEFIGRYTYSPLVVDYHENQSLEQLNSENKIGFQNPEFSHQSIPTSSIAFDRYAYSLNNPVSTVK
jgi:RHS repeat-associated protein